MKAGEKSKLALVFAAGYLLVALASLSLIFVSGDSLAGVFAVLVIQPWGTLLIWIMDAAAIDSLVFNLLFMFGGAWLNAWIIYRVVAWVVARLRRV